jgi:hypothetical protein
MIKESDMRRERQLSTTVLRVTIFAIICCALYLPLASESFFATKTMAAFQDYRVGQKVEVFWKENWYRATILEPSGHKFLVHYEGYGNEWNEVVGRKRMRAISTANPATKPNNYTNSATNPATNPSNSALPAAAFTKGNVEHNVTENGRKGMRLHFWFKIDNSLNRSCRAVAYFQYKNGTKLKARASGKYSTVDGQVSVDAPFTPKYDPVEYNDFQLFMPYDELNMSPGFSELRFFVKLYDNQRKQFFATSQYYPFNLTK